GDFVAGDARFYAAAGASGGHDADDRVVYDISNGNLWYDADGSGSGAAQLLGTLQGAPALAAPDIKVTGSAPLVSSYGYSSDPDINSVLNGLQKWGGPQGTGATVTYSFRTDASRYPDYGPSNEPYQPGWLPLSEENKDSVRHA